MVATRKWIPLNALRAFEASARTLSLTHGAELLSVAPSAVSRHVAALEVFLGHKLFLRKPSGLELTRAGEMLLPAVSRSFDRIEQVLGEIRADTPSPRRAIKVHFPPSFLQQLALPMLAEFRAQHPDVPIEIVTSFAPGLSQQGCDLAVVYDRPTVSEAIRDLLWHIQVTPACAPERAAAAAGLSFQEFLASNDLVHVRVDGHKIGYLWADFAAKAGVSLDPDRPGMVFDSLVPAVQYAMAGGGVVLIDVNMFARERADGRIATPFPITGEDSYGYYLTLAAEDLDDPAIANFRRWIISRFAQR